MPHSKDKSAKEDKGPEKPETPPDDNDADGDRVLKTRHLLRAPETDSAGGDEDPT